LVGSGQNGRIPVGLLQIQPYTGHFGQIRLYQWPDPSRSGRILAILARFDWLLTMAVFRPEFGSPASGDGDRMLSDSGAVSIPDVAGFLHLLDFDNRPLLDSDNRISNICARTKSLISENDLRF
jgi:hypothetical protein